ncbi:hypothetical protein HQ545_02365 [Candidatus Woesearchaeota archaeon]|nr:hypothetical protein [Candidatus Woesearchaeota archaeon]
MKNYMMPETSASSAFEGFFHYLRSDGPGATWYGGAGQNHREIACRNGVRLLYTWEKTNAGLKEVVVATPVDERRSAQVISNEYMTQGMHSGFFATGDKEMDMRSMKTCYADCVSSGYVDFEDNALDDVYTGDVIPVRTVSIDYNDDTEQEYNNNTEQEYGSLDGLVDILNEVFDSVDNRDAEEGLLRPKSGIRRKAVLDSYDNSWAA